MERPDAVLILTPVKDAARHLPAYFAALGRLTYTRRRLSLGFLESDSGDDTLASLSGRLPDLRRHYRRVGLWKHDFGLRLPAGVPGGRPPGRSRAGWCSREAATTCSSTPSTTRPGCCGSTSTLWTTRRM